MEFITKVDHGQKETFDKWNGKFLDETSYDTVVHSRGSGSDIIKVYKPHASLGERPLLAYCKRSYERSFGYQRYFVLHR